MSKSTPVIAIGAAAAMAVTAALTQLGLASGLAILIWREGSAEEWAAHLAWGAFLAAAATIAGGLTAARLTTDTGPRITATVAAGIGSFVLAPLLAVPAMRFEDTAIATAPFVAVGIGALAGMIATGVALAWQAVHINVLATLGLTWALGALAAFVPIGDDSGVVKLAVWSEWTGPSVPMVPTLLAGSLLLGMVTAWIMTGPEAVGDHRVTAIAGGVGPLLLVAAYAAAGRGDVGVTTQWHGMGVGAGAVVAGLLGTLLVTALRRPSNAPADPNPPATVTATAAVEPPTLGDPIADQPTQTLAAEPSADRTHEVPAADPAPVADPYVSAEYDEAALTQYVDTRAAAGHAADVRGTEFDEPAAPPPPPPPAPEPEPVPEPKPAKKKATKRAKKAAKPRPEPEPELPPEPAPEPPQETKAMPAAEADADWLSGLRDEHSLINEHNEHDEAATTEAEPESAPDRKRRWGLRKKDK